MTLDQEPKFNIVIVDPNRKISAALHDLLGRDGHSVKEFHDSNLAANFLSQKGEIDLLITEVVGVNWENLAGLAFDIHRAGVLLCTERAQAPSQDQLDQVRFKRNSKGLGSLPISIVHKPLENLVMFLGWIQRQRTERLHGPTTSSN